MIFETPSRISKRTWARFVDGNVVWEAVVIHFVVLGNRFDDEASDAGLNENTSGLHELNEPRIRRRPVGTAGIQSSECCDRILRPNEITL